MDDHGILWLITERWRPGSLPQLGKVTGLSRSILRGDLAWLVETGAAEQTTTAHSKNSSVRSDKPSLAPANAPKHMREWVWKLGRVPLPVWVVHSQFLAALA